MDADLPSLRVDYGRHELRAATAGSDPMAVFDAWFNDALMRDSVAEANAMALATASAVGIPSVRMVLLKAVDPERAAFTWFTNLASRKSQEAFEGASVALGGTPSAAITWWWPGSDSEPSRQVRAVGAVELLDRAAVRTYFRSRSPEAQVGAAASRQSQVVATRGELDARAAAIDPSEVELPDTWGGLTLVAHELEFWQGRSGRLHDRIRFQRAGSSDVDGPPPATGITRVVDPYGTAWNRARLEP